MYFSYILRRLTRPSTIAAMSSSPTFRMSLVRCTATWLALSLSGVLNACGGGGGGGGGGGAAPAPQPPAPPPPPAAITISAASGSAQTRLPCNQANTADTECGLRMYQVMVEAFIDGDAGADYNVGWGSSHHKGDLQGVINSLDYIKGLGVNAIWLTPVFESVAVPGQDSNASRLDATGYFASNYFKIDPKFGTLAQARTLVDEAHKRGLYVFFDGVFGHHKGNVVPSPNGRLPVGGNDPVSYPGSLEFYKEVATYWVKELKIDGWRLDQAYQVPLSAWTDLRAAVQTASQSVSYTNSQGQTVNPLGYMVAEIWRGENDIASGAYGSNASPALNSAFDFPGRYRLVQTLAVEESGSGKTAATNLKGVFDTHNAYPNHAKPNLMLANHDLLRFGDLLQRGNVAEPTQDAYWQRHKAALSFMAAYSGPITLYYGDEIGQEVPNFAQSVANCGNEGKYCDDHVSRSSGMVEGLKTTLADAAPVALNSRQSDLKAHTQALMALRAANPALWAGSRTHVYSDATLYLDRKEAGSNRVLYVLNTGTSSASLKVAPDALGGASTGLTDLQSGATVSVSNSYYELTVPALSARFLRY
jgi:glycosidase